MILPFIAAIALASVANPAAPASTIEFHTDRPVSGTFTFRSAGEPSRIREARIDGASFALEELAGSEWDVSFASDSWWSPKQRIVFPAAGAVEQRPIRFWRTGIVAGKVIEGEKGLQIPKAITLSVESPPMPSRPQEIPRGTEFDCPVAADGTWSCRVPAVTLDLALRPAGMTPHYRWDVAVTTERPNELGTFALRKGASMVAWLDSRTAKVLAEPAQARLLRPIANAPSATTMRLREPVVMAAFTRRGMAQLAPVPPGSYVLEVGAKGYAPSRIGPIEVYEGKETEFRKPIELKPPVTVTVAIEPPQDSNHLPWHVRLDRQTDFLAPQESSVRGTAGADGQARFTDQSPGVFYATIEDAKGNHLWSGSEVIGEDGEPAIRAKIDLRRVKGKLLLGDSGLKAALWFGTSRGTERVRIDSDDEGIFEGSLPRLGEWTIEIESEDPPVHSLNKVVVDNNDEMLEIHLPDTQISGWVVASHGQRVQHGHLLVSSGGIGIGYSANVAADGSFILRGLPAGDITVIAQDQETGEKSQRVRIRLSEGQRLEGIELRTEGERDVAGSVTSQGSALVGARIIALPLDIIQPNRDAVTDTMGRFTVRLPAASQRALLIVLAPGRVLQSFERHITDEPLVLDVAPVGGTLKVISPSFVRLTQNGLSIPPPAFFDWIAAHGRDPSRDYATSIPDLAPGPYQACTGDVASPHCKNGVLAPGGELVLDLSN